MGTTTKRETKCWYCGLPVLRLAEDLTCGSDECSKGGAEFREQHGI